MLVAGGGESQRGAANGLRLPIDTLSARSAPDKVTGMRAMVDFMLVMGAGLAVVYMLWR